MKTAWNAIAVAMNMKQSASGGPNDLAQVTTGHLTSIAMARKDKSTMMTTEDTWLLLL